MDHTRMFQVHSWIKSKKRLFQSRVILCLIAFFNMSNSTVLALDLFGAETLLSAGLVVLIVTVTATSFAAVHVAKPMLFIPNVATKVSFSSGALFYGLQLAESAETHSTFYFVWLMSIVVFFIWEIQLMFSVAFEMIKQITSGEYSKPPPTYHEAINNIEEPPCYEIAIRRMQLESLDVEALPKVHPTPSIA